MIIDTADGSGCSHIPRYNSSAKRKPARHTMLIIKTTFIKVHRIGSLLVVTVTIPDIEKQCGNLPLSALFEEYNLK